MGFTLFAYQTNIYENIINPSEPGAIGHKNIVAIGICNEELSILKTSQIEEFAGKYFSSPRKTPLMVFHDGTDETPDIFHRASERAFGAGMVKVVKTTKKDVSALEAQTEELTSLPHKVIEIHYGSLGMEGYDEIILLAEKLATASGKFIILYCKYANSLHCDSNNRIAHDDWAEHCFDTWHNRIDMFVADNKGNDYSRLLELYLSSIDRGTIAHIDALLEQGKKEEAKTVLEEALNKKNSFAIVKDEDKGDCIRRYVVSAVPTAEETKTLEKCHISSESLNEILTSWYDISKENGEIVNWEHTVSNFVSKKLGIPLDMYLRIK